MRLIQILLFIFSCTAVCSSAFSAQVLKVKGSAILIDTAGEDIRMGKTYYLMSNNKKKGIVKIVKLRPGQALAKLLKGKALADWTLKERKPVSSKKSTAQVSTPKLRQPKRTSRNRVRTKSSSSSKKLSLGFALGFSQNSSDVDFLASNVSAPRSDSYTGNSLSFEGLLDYQVGPKISIRSSLGMQSFNTEDPDNTQCQDSNTPPNNVVCKIDLSYINIDFWLRYHFNKGKANFWAGAGIGALFSPQYNSTTALKEDDLSTTTLLQIGGGADVEINEKLYIPFWVEYGMYPSSDTVKMSSISGYLGLAYKL